MKINYVNVDGNNCVKIECEESDNYFFSFILGNLRENSLMGRIETISEMLNNEASVTNGIDNELRLRVWKEFVRPHLNNEEGA